jgi:hypothetical protein
MGTLSLSHTVHILFGRIKARARAGIRRTDGALVTESSDTSDMPAKPQDYAGLRAELATLVNDFSPLINELWPRLEDHKYRWELHSWGLPEGHDKLVVTDIIGFADRGPQGHRRHR